MQENLGDFKLTPTARIQKEAQWDRDGERRAGIGGRRRWLER